MKNNIVVLQKKLEVFVNLIPLPRQYHPVEPEFKLEDGLFIVLTCPNPQALRYAAQKIQEAVKVNHNLNWQITAGLFPPLDQVGVSLTVTPGALGHAQGYELQITQAGISIIGEDSEGVFYGVCTLLQILAQTAGVVPGMQIRDWPDFPSRGVMLDISRDKVPQMKTIFNLVDLLSGLKINQVQLYTEHTFAYSHHRSAWEKASPFTAEEILALDAFCKERFIELVPNQNSFGHLHRWLTLPEYNSLAEAPQGCQTEWGWMEPFSLNPLDPASLEFLRGLYDDLLPNFSSKMVNIGCDETVDLGHGHSREACEQLGKGRVYLDFLLKIYREIRTRGRTMQFWGDIILQHPEYIPLLPKDIIALEWGYEADHPFEAHCQQFSSAGIPFYVCPGTSSWCSLAGRTTNALKNLISAAENGLKYGATGYLNTDWGDHGHWQPLPVSYLGFAAGAAYSWALEANRNLPIQDALSWHLFKDKTGNMSRVACELGEMYQYFGQLFPNNSPFFFFLSQPLSAIGKSPLVTQEKMNAAIDRVSLIIKGLENAEAKITDSTLVRQEFELAAWLIRHSCKRAILAIENEPSAQERQRRELMAELDELKKEFERIWLLRNREGGLVDSLRKLEKNLVSP
jgi:hexosaminidase